MRKILISFLVVIFQSSFAYQVCVQNNTDIVITYIPGMCSALPVGVAKNAQKCTPCTGPQILTVWNSGPGFDWGTEICSQGIDPSQNPTITVTGSNENYSCN